MRRLIILFTCVFLLSACNTIKLIHLMKSGEVDGESFYAEIPFEIRGGIIILKTLINGEEYDFYLDTGAPNVISKEIAEKLGVKPNCNVSSSDSQGNKGKIEFGKLGSITIGDVEFKNQGTAVVDFSENKELACMDMDGIIGANLMKECFWQINMKSKTIIITSDKARLEIIDNAAILPFEPTLIGTPEVNIKFENIEVSNVVFDYGSNGGIMICTDKIDKLLKNHENVIRSFGEAGIGLYGSTFDTNYTIACDSIQIGSLTLNEVSEFARKGKSTIGTEIFENFTITIDWEEKQIYMEHIEEIKSLECKTFGLGAILRDDTLRVVYIYENSPAADAGIELETRILEMNGKDCTNLSDEEYCQMIVDGMFPDEMEEVNISFLKDGKLVETTLIKRNILEN